MMSESPLMKDLTSTLASRAEPTPPPSDTEGWVLEPYLHVGEDRVYNPLTDLEITTEDFAFPELVSVISGETSLDDLDASYREVLTTRGWMVDQSTDLDGRHLLKYVSLEAHTVCNQACYFCPVAYAPREKYFMPTELYESIVDKLSLYKETIEGVIMISYNEPTIDPRFLDQVRLIRDAGLPPAALSNGSGLTPGKTDGLLALGGLRFFSVNISTLNREKYAKDRGGDHLVQVLKNLDYAKDKPIAEDMDMVVLGTGDEQHKQDFEALQERFAGSLFEVKYFEVNDRAGILDVGIKVDASKQKLKGCSLIGSRPLQHLHINPYGECILCCQDYSGHHVVGDLREQDVAEILRGDELRKMRRWTYGLDEAPDDFICRSCEFALVE